MAAMPIGHNFMCLEIVESLLRKGVCWGVVTAVLDNSSIDNHKVKLYILLKNPCFCLSVLFCCLEHQMHNGFLIQISQNVS